MLAAIELPIQLFQVSSNPLQRFAIMDFDQVDAPWFFHEKIAEMGYPHYFRVVSRSEFPFCKVFLIACRCLAPEVAKAEL